VNEIPSEPRLDEESGLYTQTIMQALLRHEVARIKRYPSPLSLMYVALQFSKPPSEDVYRSAQLFLANILQSRLREVDMPGHFEGNYLVALPNTDTQGTRTAATRLIQQARGKQISRSAIEYSVAICIGITSHPGGDSISLAEILSQAASALWEAERRGPESMACYDEIAVK
jgi:diguanylate cyclase (GGDEF)-like protein